MVNTLTGGNGNDTYTLHDNFGLNVIIDPAGIDTVDLSTATGNLVASLVSGSGAEASESNGNRIDWDNDAIENFLSGSGNDKLTGNAAANLLDGGAGNDTLIGGAGNDQLLGGLGDDLYVFQSGFGKDTVNDAGGNDTLDFSNFATAVTVNLTLGTASADAGASTLSGLSAIENIIGGAGGDNLIGNSANNWIAGGAGNDTINGLLGDDTLDGGTGNDAITGGGGNELMTGGAGDDTYIFKAGFGIDHIFDSSGNDTINLTAFNISSVSSWQAVDNNTDGRADSLLMQFDANNSILIQDYFSYDAASNTLGQGAGYIETIAFADAPQVTLSQVQNHLNA